MVLWLGPNDFGGCDFDGEMLLARGPYHSAKWRQMLGMTASTEVTGSVSLRGVRLAGNRILTRTCPATTYNTSYKHEAESDNFHEG